MIVSLWSRPKSSKAAIRKKNKKDRAALSMTKLQLASARWEVRASWVDLP